MTPDDVRVITDPHVANAIMALALALVAALAAWILVMADDDKR